MAFGIISCTESNEDNISVNPIITDSFEFVSKDESISSLALEVEKKSYAIIRNNSTEDKDVNVKLRIISLEPGHMVSMCTHNCFQPTTEDWQIPSDRYFTVPAGGDSGFLNGGNGFSAHFYPNGISGVSQVEFIFYDVNNTEDKVSYIVTYTAK